MSHLHKCDAIAVVSQGEIVDQGVYNDLMQSSKILRELVYSMNTANSEPSLRRASDAGAYKDVAFTHVIGTGDLLFRKVQRAHLLLHSTGFIIHLRPSDIMQS